MVQNDNEIGRLIQEIEQYLLTHPNAADTIEGIAKWWLQQQRYMDSVECIHNALDVLIERGLVKKRTNADGKNIYRYSCSHSDITC